MNARARARKGEGERLRDEIIDAATKLLIETGDEDAVTIRAVAKEVGVTPPAIYLHFEDKTNLLLAVCQQQFATFDEHIELAVAGVDDPLEELAARGRAYIRFGLDNPEHYRILFMTRPLSAAALLTDEDLITSAAFDHHVQAVQRAQDAGAIPAEVDTMLAAVGLWAAVHGITSLLIAKPFFPWPDQEKLLDHILESAVKGLSS